ncbi:MAG: hypothetical protein K8W52_03050 [Deltaproteobacteria bacterium]|nr:hypothetical protein [Deltaproteobacteria bacterium]
MRPHVSPPVIDGVPHDVIGYLAMGIVGVAMVMFWGYVVSGIELACVLGVMVGGFAIIRLSHRAQRERVEEGITTTDERDEGN